MVRILKFLVALLIMIQTQHSFSQVIRKNWREMTTHEKDVYINALRALYTKSPNVIETYVNTHANSTYVRHNQLDFLLWHRMFIYYFEKELINSGVANAGNISLPYWGWETSGDWSSSSPMFSSGTNNLGLFGYPIPEGTFGRAFGQSTPQPSAAELDGLSTSYTQFGTDYFSQQGTNFWPRLEAVYHNTYHGFIGGSGTTSQSTMSYVSISPRDPIFYQHHCYVDKIWQDWHNKNGSSSIANQNVLINTIPGQPQILRSGTVDSRSLKVWYAYNGQAKLDAYTVTNTENYRYTGTITISNASSPSTKFFSVPSGTTCNVVAGVSIFLEPGFTVSSGAIFSAKVDPVSNPSSTFNTGRTDTNDIASASKVENAEEPFGENKFQIFPNPSSNGIFTVTLLTNDEINYQYTVFDMMGKIILNGKDYSSDKQFDIDLNEKPGGMYLVHLKVKEGKTYLKKIVSK